MLQKLTESKFNKSKKNVNVFCNSNKIPFFEFRSESGIDVIISQDKSREIVTTGFLYKVGSRNELHGQKGIAHLFEHLMFQGSGNIPKMGHFKFIQQAGGTLNAFTMADYTAYYEQVPSHQLETCFWLESDRLYDLRLTEENLQNQKDVVIEERMQNYDNAPYGLALFKLFENLMRGSSYETPTIGLPVDIKDFSLTQALEFHNNYYRPDNLIIAVSGNVEQETVEEYIGKYFSTSKSGEIPTLNLKDYIPLVEDKLEVIESNVALPGLFIGYQLPGFDFKRNIIADIFNELLINSTSSRLYRKLVYQKKLVTDLTSHLISWQKCAIVTQRFFYPDISSRNIILEIFDREIESFVSGDISERELEKAKNKKLLSVFLGISTLLVKNLQALYYKFYLNDPNNINELYKIIESVTADDIVNFVNEIF